jgi:hypothetical protein
MAITIDRNLGNGEGRIAFCDSPQYIAATSDGVGGKATIWTCKVYVWHGIKSKSLDSADLAITLQTAAVPQLGDATTASFEISNYILDKIDVDQNPTIIYGSPTYNEDNGVWVRIEVDNDVDTPYQTPLGNPNFCTGGYGLYVDGANPSTTIQDVQGVVFGHQSPTLLFNQGRDYVIPVFIGDGSTNDTLLTSSGSLALDTDLGFTLGSLESDQQIGYIILSSKDWNWINGEDFYYSITSTGFIIPLGVPQYAAYFDGTDHCNLGKVPLITTGGDFFEIKFKATSWLSETPYGYEDGTNGSHYIQPSAGGYAPSSFFIQATVFTNSNLYNTEDPIDTQVVRFEYFDPTNVSVTVNGNSYGVFPNIITTNATSLVDFYLGGRNQSNSAAGLTECIIEYVNFNGTVYDDTSAWGGAGTCGTRIVSFDGGVTWYRAEEVVYKANIVCTKGRPKSLKYLNAFGAYSDFPINGSDFDTVISNKTNFNNLKIDASGGYDTGRHVNRTFSVDDIWNVQLYTGFIFEDTPRMVSEMLLSKFVFYEVIDDTDLTNDVYPAQITNSQIRFIRRLYERRVGYDISIQIARPLINNVT